MLTRSRFAFFSLLAISAAASAGCRPNMCAQMDSAPATGAATPTPSDAQRAIAEADIIQLAGDRLYAMSSSGSLSVIDVSNPKGLTVLGKSKLAGVPFEMYLRGDLVIVMSNGAIAGDGTPNKPTADGATLTPVVDPKQSAAVMVFDAKDPSNIVSIGTFPAPGEVGAARRGGAGGYVVSFENAACW